MHPHDLDTAGFALAELLHEYQFRLEYAALTLEKYCSDPSTPDSRMTEARNQLAIAARRRRSIANDLAAHLEVVGKSDAFRPAARAKGRLLVLEISYLGRWPAFRILEERNRFLAESTLLIEPLIKWSSEETRSLMRL